MADGRHRWSDALAAHRDGATLRVAVTPRSGKTAFGEVVDGAIRVQVAAPPVDGAANAALVRFVAQAAGVPRGRVRLVSGERGRAKAILVAGLTVQDLAARLERSGGSP